MKRGVGDWKQGRLRPAEIIGDPTGGAYCAGSMARLANPGRAGWAGTIRRRLHPSRPPAEADDAGRGFTMKVLARIPLMSPAPAPHPHVVALDEPVPPVLPPARLPASSRARARRPRFPTVSVTALALMAAAAWSLATWNDARRAERSRLERLARMHAPTAAAETVAR
jgi:hypothetical protein